MQQGFLISGLFIGYFAACVVGSAYDVASYRSPSFGALRGYTTIHWVGAVVDDAVLHLPSFRKWPFSSLTAIQVRPFSFGLLAFILGCDSFVRNYSLS